jgi:pyridoxal phosphate enzyme (YggS family)
LALVRQRIQRACERSHRDPSSVTLVCVTKTIPADVVAQVVALGVRDVGENRVQEAQRKRDAIVGQWPSVRWHLIGHLQRNKAKAAVELFEMIHSVDSVELVNALDRHAVHPTDVFIQVNVSGEATKGGCRPDEVGALAQRILRASHLRLAGLMTMAPLSDDPDVARPVFRRLRQLRDQLALPVPLRLSMGMSQDFEVAIEEGADLVRVGTAIFGARSN